MKIIALIPARGGSKGIKKKNILKLGGKPLLAHTIEKALLSPHIDRVIVSSDDDEILAVAGAFGAEALKRPEEHAGDSSKMDETLMHAIQTLEKEGYESDMIVLLQPTSPLRTVETINAAIEQFKDKMSEFDSLMPLSETSNKIGEIENGRFIPSYMPGTQRQELKKKYFDCGTIHIFKPDVIKAGKFFGDSVLAFTVNWPESHDIDTEDDIRIAEFFLKDK